MKRLLILALLVGIIAGGVAAQQDISDEYTGNSWDISGDMQQDTIEDFTYGPAADSYQDFYVADNDYGTNQDLKIFDTSFSQIGNLDIGGSRIGGVTTRGYYLFAHDRYQQEIKRIDSGTAAIADTYDMSSAFAQDDMNIIMWDQADSRFHIGDRSTQVIKEFNYDNTATSLDTTVQTTHSIDNYNIGSGSQTYGMIYNGRAYLLNGGGTIAVYDADNYNELGVYDVSSVGSPHAITAANNQLYMLDSGGTVYEFNEFMESNFNLTNVDSGGDTYTGQDINVNATVTNTGGIQGTKTVELRDGVNTYDTQSVTLNAGESQNITLTIDGSTADTPKDWFLYMETPDDTVGFPHTVLEREIYVAQTSPSDGQNIPYWEAVTQTTTFEWSVDTVPETSYDTGIQLEGQSENLGFSGTGNQTFSTDQTFLSSQTGITEWSATAEATNYNASGTSTDTVVIDDPRHEILSADQFSPVKMVGETEVYDYTFQYEMGEPVGVGLASGGDEIYQCEQIDDEYQTGGLCERTESGSLTLSSTGLYSYSVEVEGQDTGVTDQQSLGSVDVYDPSATITGPVDTELDYQDRNQNVSLTWDSAEEDVTAYLYFNGDQISNETLGSGDTLTESIQGDVGENEYYFEVEGETSGDTHTFDTRSFSVGDYSLNVTLDKTRFGNNQPLANTPAYYTGSNPEVPLEVENGTYQLPYQTTSWDSANKAVYYGWISNQIPSGQREVSDDILGEDINGNVTGPVTVDITYSFDSLNSDGNFSVELGDTVGETQTTLTFNSGNSANQITETGLFSGDNLDESFFTNGLDIAVENNLDQELTIDEITLNNVEDRPRAVWGEEFRTVALDTESVDPDDLQFWFEIDGSNATAPVQTEEVNPLFMELRGWNGVTSEELDRDGFVATWEKQNRRDTFGLPDEINQYNSSGLEAPQSVIIENGSERQVLFFFDLNDQVTEEHIVTNGTLYATDGELTDSVDFEYSSGVDFRNFQSSSDLETLDTTLSFDSESDLVSDGEYVSEANPPIRVERDLDTSVLEPVEDPNGNDFDRDTEISGENASFAYTFRNTHSHDIRLYTDLTLGTSDPVYGPNELIEITPTTEVAGDGGWTVGELLQENVDVREQLFERDNITKELEIDGDNLERGELTVTYQLEDSFENFREVERTFKIRENNFKGKFYQLFDNYFQIQDWVVGLFLFLIIAVGGMLLLDWKISFLVGSTFGLVASIALLWTGFLPLQINLLIMVILAGLSAIALRKVIG